MDTSPYLPQSREITGTLVNRQGMPLIRHVSDSLHLFISPCVNCLSILLQLSRTQINGHLYVKFSQYMSNLDTCQIYTLNVDAWVVLKAGDTQNRIEKIGDPQHRVVEVIQQNLNY